MRRRRLLSPRSHVLRGMDSALMTIRGQLENAGIVEKRQPARLSLTEVSPLPYLRHIPIASVFSHIAVIVLTSDEAMIVGRSTGNGPFEAVLSRSRLDETTFAPPKFLYGKVSVGSKKVYVNRRQWSRLARPKA